MVLKTFKKFFYKKTADSQVRRGGATSSYTSDGSIYKPYGALRDTETGKKFTIILRKISLEVGPYHHRFFFNTYDVANKCVMTSVFFVAFFNSLPISPCRALI